MDTIPNGCYSIKHIECIRDYRYFVVLKNDLCLAVETMTKVKNIPKFARIPAKRRSILIQNQTKYKGHVRLDRSRYTIVSYKTLLYKGDFMEELL